MTDHELLAVRYFMEYYKQYLLGRKFLVRTPPSTEVAVQPEGAKGTHSQVVGNTVSFHI